MMSNEKARKGATLVRNSILLAVLLATGLLVSCTMVKGMVSNDEIQEVPEHDGKSDRIVPVKSESGTYRVLWSRYTNTVNKEYSVLGIVVVRGTVFPAYDLMEAAKELKAGDIIKIRIDTKEEMS
jgi:site-specific recombinase XerD